MDLRVKHILNRLFSPSLWRRGLGGEAAFLCLLLLSCGEHTEPDSPVASNGELVKVTRSIQVSVLPMQTVGGVTRADADKPEEGEAIHVSYGSNAFTRVQEGETDNTIAESVINNAYILQFSGTALSSVLEMKKTLTPEQVRSGSSITCDFVMTAGTKNRVYVVANCSGKSLVVGSTTLQSFFEFPVLLEPTTEVPSGGLPMSACQDVGVGDSFEPFQLKSLLAKLTFTTNAGAFQFNVPRGYSFYTQSVAGDHAVRPAGMEYRLSTILLSSGTTYYIPENLSGRNNLLINSITRCAYFAPENASYVEISGGEKKCIVYLGDGTPQDFNVEGNHWYHVNVNVLGYNDMDLRVGNPTITDLNADGQTANCYIAPSANAWYMLNTTVMGNGATTPLPADMSSGPVAAPIVPKPLHPKSADVLWETLNTTSTPNKGDVVKSKIYYLKDGRALFRTGSKEGNAVIAARDAQNNIIWSWHIWRTNFDPATTARGLLGIGSISVSGEIVMMERNLGALKAIDDVLASGLHYQWGRKDPFPGYDGAVGTTAATIPNGIPVIPVSTAQYTIAQSVAQPTTFFKNYGDWCSPRNDNLWGTPLIASVSINNGVSTYTYNNNYGSKSIYDPCPVGWRVPPGYVWANISTKNIIWKTPNVDLKSITQNASSAFWITAKGFRKYNDGMLNVAGSYARYWTSTSGPSSIANGNCLNISDGGEIANPGAGYSRAYGYSVRCVFKRDVSPPSDIVNGGVNDSWGNSITNPSLGNSDAGSNK